jgi:biopolymer transport protein ExbD
MFAFDTPRRPRRPSLTPMIDVVFLLLVFFMLAARFGAETALGVATGGAHGDWKGPPRLVEIDAEGVRLNGVRLPRASLAAALSPLMPTADSPVVLRAVPGAEVSDLADVLGRLRAAGIGSVVVVE